MDRSLNSGRLEWAREVVRVLRRVGLTVAAVHLLGAITVVGLTALAAPVLTGDVVRTVGAYVVGFLAHSCAVAAAFARSAEPRIPMRTTMRVVARGFLPFLGRFLIVSGVTALGAIPLLVLVAVVGRSWVWLGLGALVGTLWTLLVAAVFAPTLAAAVLLERRGIRRCVELVRGRLRAMLLRVFIVDVVVLVWAGTLAPVAQVSPSFEHAITTLIAVPAWTVVSVAAVVTYAELRAWADPRVRLVDLAEGLRR